MNRSGHYVEAQRLANVAVQVLDSGRVDRLEMAALYCQAALVHATLATAPPEVEQSAQSRERHLERKAATAVPTTELQTPLEQLEQLAASVPPAKPGPHLHTVPPRLKGI